MQVCTVKPRSTREWGACMQDIYTWVTNGQGILGSQGDYNAKHRRLCSPMFRTPKLLKKFSHVITERSVEIADALSEAAAAWGGLKTDVSLQTQRLTLDIVGLTAFSHNFQQVRSTRHLACRAVVYRTSPWKIGDCFDVLKNARAEATYAYPRRQGGCGGEGVKGPWIQHPAPCLRRPQYVAGVEPFETAFVPISLRTPYHYEHLPKQLPGQAASACRETIPVYHACRWIRPRGS